MPNEMPNTVPNAMHQIKPHKFYFFLQKLLPWSFLLLASIVASVVFLSIIPLFIGLLIFAIAFWIASVSYQKTIYYFFPNKIVYETGTPFSDSEVEFPIKNITHIRLQLPFLVYRFFNIGNLNIDTAGGDATEGNFVGIFDPKKIFEELESVMKNNGFVMEQKNLVQEMVPNKLAVILDTLKFIGIAGGIIFLNIIDMVVDDGDPETMEISAVSALLFGGIFFLGSLAWAALRYFDLKKRLYRVYDDCITYSEGFLTKNFSIIPFENISDSASTQSFVARIFGVYDVKISCLGAKKEIDFSNIIEGNIVSEKIRTAVQAFKQVQKEKKSEKIASEKQTEKETTQHEERNFDNEYTQNFQMNFLRAVFAPLVILALGCVILAILPEFSIPFFLLGGIFLVRNGILVSATKYIVESNSIQYRYKFLNTHNVEFFSEKITSVVLQESWIDKIFGTCQIHFGSVGSSQKIKFLHLKKQENLYENILKKVGIAKEEKVHEILPMFGLGNFFKSQIFSFIVYTIIFVLTAFALAFSPVPVLAGVEIFVVGIVGVIIYSYLSFFYKRAKVEFFHSFLSVTKGILIQTTSFSAYENIKDINTVKYPLTSAGAVSFDVAGDDVTNLDVQNQKTALTLAFGNLGAASLKMTKYSHILALKFLPNIPLQNDLLDQFLRKNLTATEVKNFAETLEKNPLTAEFSEKPDIANTIAIPAFLGVACIIALTMLGLVEIAMIIALVVGIVLGCVVWSLRCVSFELQDFRVVKKSGIFYKKNASVLFAKIDNLNKSRNFFNKIFGNGSLTIQTIGSSAPEIAMNDLEKYLDFYEKIKAKI